MSQIGHFFYHTALEVYTAFIDSRNAGGSDEDLYIATGDIPQHVLEETPDSYILSARTGTDLHRVIGDWHVEILKADVRRFENSQDGL